MPVSFLNPGLLVGALGALVPLLLHLWRRRRVRREPFPDLTFLEEIQATRSRSLGLRRWLLLLLRMLAILLVVLAAARPRSNGPLERGDGLVVILDASASMQAVDDGASRAVRAERLLRDLLAAASPDLPCQVIVAGSVPHALFDDWLPAGTAVAALPASLPPADTACDMAAAIALAGDLVDETVSRPVVALVTDGQLPTAGADSLAAALARLHRRGSGPVVVQRIGRPVDDGAVLAVAVPELVLRPGETVTLAAEVLPRQPDQRFWLELDGERVAEATVATPGRRTTVELTFTAPPEGLHRGTVRTTPDRVPFDDAVPFWLPVRGEVRILLAHGPDRDEPGEGGWRFLAAALSPPDSEAVSGSPFRLRERSSETLVPGDLDGVDLVVLVDPVRPRGGLVEGLRGHLTAGGGLWLLCGRQQRGEDLRRRWLPLFGLPPTATWRSLAPAAAEGWRIDLPAHPLLAGLPRGALATLTGVRWRRFWELAASDSCEVPVSFEGGGPALLLGRLGRGRWALAPWDLSRDAGDLSANPMFPPLAQRLAGLLVRGAVPAFAVAAGEPLTFIVPPEGPSGEGEALEVVRADTEGRVLERLPATVSWRGGLPVVAAGTADHRGIVTLEREGRVLAAAAVAAPPAEATAPLLDRRGWSDLLGRGIAWHEEGSAGQAWAGWRGRELSSWLLLAAVLVLLLETALSRGDPDGA